MKKGKETIANILGDEKLITLTHREFNELVAGYEKRKSELDEREKSLDERFLEIEEFEKGLVKVYYSPGFHKDNARFCSIDDSVKKIKERMNIDFNNKFKLLKEQIIEDIGRFRLPFYMDN